LLTNTPTESHIHNAHTYTDAAAVVTVERASQDVTAGRLLVCIHTFVEKSFGNVHTHVYVGHTCQRVHIRCRYMYGVATVSRIDKITGLFCRIWSLL